MTRRKTHSKKSRMAELGHKYAHYSAPFIREQATYLPLSRSDLFPVLKDVYKLMEQNGEVSDFDVLPVQLQDEFLNAWWDELDLLGIYQGHKTFKRMHNIP